MAFRHRRGSSALRGIVNLILSAVPWQMRRRLLAVVWGYELHPTSRIGRLSWVAPYRLAMGPGSSIGNFAVCRGVERVELGRRSKIGQWCWITGANSANAHLFVHETGRCSALLLQDYAVLTSRHYVDCTNTVTVGEATVVAGIRTSLFSHAVSIHHGRQESKPVTIGKYCFVGTNCVVLPGAVLPDYSVLSALSVLGRGFDETYTRYAGSPAQAVERYEPDTAYFVRDI